MGFFFDLIVRWTGGRFLDTSDQALDSAADFQRGFETYIGLYNDYTGSSLSMQTDIQQPYDELREIDFARLSEVAEQAALVADDVDQQVEDINTQVATVDGWTGNAANAFRGYVQQLTTATTTIEQDLGAIATATGEAVPAAQQVIAEYVDAIGDIDFSDFDSTEIIALLIRVERYALSVGDLIRELSDRLGDLLGIAIPVFGGGGGGFSLNPVDIVRDVVTTVAGSLVDLVLDFFGMAADQFLEWVAGKAREYLDASFRQPFDSNLQLLHDAVEAAKTGIEEAFQPVIAAADAVNPSPFAALPVPPEDNPTQPATPPPAAPTTPSTPTVPSTPSAPTAPSTPSAPPSTPSVPSVPSGPSTPPASTPPATSTPTPTVPSVPSGPTPTVPPVTVPPVDTPPAGGPTPTVPPVDLPTPQPGDGPGGRPDDLPPGAGWIADPSQLPQGWTVDPETGQLLPPGAPGGAGDPEVHSPEGQDVLDGDENDDDDVSILPIADDPSGAGGPTSVTFEEGDVRVTISADGGPDDGISITLTDDDGNQTEYAVRVGEDGRPELVPVESTDTGSAANAVTSVVDSAEPVAMSAPPSGPSAGLPTYATASFEAQPAYSGGSGSGGSFEAQPVGSGAPVSAGVGSGGASLTGEVPASTMAAAVGFASGSDTSAVAGSSGSGATSGGGGPAFAAGDVTGGGSGGPSYADSGYAGGRLDTGQVLSGGVSGGLPGGDGAAQLASASGTGSAGTPGAAQLASAGDAPAGGQHAGGAGAGAPMMPMTGGAAGGGDEERRPSGSWQLPGSDVFEAEQAPTAGGVIGNDR